MKQVFLCLLVLAGIALGSCEKSVDAPDCVKATIEDYRSNPNWITYKVDEYYFKGKLVYLFIDDTGISDGGISVVDANCNTLCFLGGIGALTTCEGEKFFEKAIYRRTVWQR